MASVIHISIPGPIPGTSDDGTVVMSGYTRSQATNNHWFMFTTMISPLDGNHPVAGNRMFAIQPDATNGGYVFYIAGVDRTYSPFVTSVNEASNAAFIGADELWTSVQNGVVAVVNSSQSNGSANLYSPPFRKVRPKWNEVVKKYLQGQITFLQMKLLLHCP